jgi:drug/metabolite transporter (DMT)-like permease
VITHRPSAIQTRRAWLAWSVVCVVWGTTYLGIKISLATIPPMLVGGLRYTAAGLIMAAGLRAAGHRLPGRGSLGTLALLGALMLTCGNGGVVWAEQYIPSGLAAVLVGMTPFWMVGIDAMLPSGDRLHRRQVVGLVIGLTGIALLVWPDLWQGGAGARATAIGIVSLQVASIGWSVASAYTRRHMLPGDVLGAAAVQMFCGGASMLVIGTALGEWGHLSFSLRTGVAMTYLTLVGSIVAFASYSYALRHLPVAVVSLYTYVNPVIAVTLGIVVLGEPFAGRQVVAAVVIFFGMAVVRPPWRRAAETST